MIRLFFSYSHKDEDLRNELEAHLALLRRQGVISSWHDRRISAGKNIGEEIDVELESSQIILLLVSAHFLDSDYCYEREMAFALEKSKSGTVIIIPVILHPCDWHSAPFGQLRATPTDGKPVSMFGNQHEAFSIIAKDIRAAAESFNSMSTSIQNPSDPETMLEPPAHARSSNLRVKRKFDDQERDQFLEDSYEYIARYFDGSLKELAERNVHIKTKFKRIDAASFTASIYDSGKRVAQCSVWYGSKAFGFPSIVYSNSDQGRGTSYNESLSVEDDGFTLHLRPMGMQSIGQHTKEDTSQQGAAELYWDLLIRPLQ